MDDSIANPRPLTAQTVAQALGYVPARQQDVRQTVVNASIDGGLLVLDLSFGSIFEASNNEDISSIQVRNAAPGALSFCLQLTANGTAYTQAWPWTWMTGTPVLSTMVGKRDLAVVWSFDGVEFFAAMIGQGF
jgi:hypothetical protein